jgi:hypothetical protein
MQPRRHQTVEGGDANLGRWKDAGVQKLGGVGDTSHAFDRVGQGDERMRLAAAVIGVQAEDGCDLIRAATESQAHIAQQILESAGRVGVREEFNRVEVLCRGVAAQDLGEVRREIRLGDRALQNVPAGGADVEDGRQGHSP